MTDFKVGDRVRATLGENVLVGTLSIINQGDNAGAAIETGDHELLEFWLDFGVGWHIEKVSPPLPTKVGAIVRRADGELFVRDSGEDWLHVRSALGAYNEDVSNGGFEVIFEGVDA